MNLLNKTKMKQWIKDETGIPHVVERIKLYFQFPQI